MVLMLFFSNRVGILLENNIYDAAFELFYSSLIFSQFNYISVTLVPKIQSPTSVAHFRPIIVVP